MRIESVVVCCSLQYAEHYYSRFPVLHSLQSSVAPSRRLSEMAEDGGQRWQAESRGVANNAVATAQSALPLVENSEQAPQLAAPSPALSPLSSPTSLQEQDTIKAPAESTPCQVKPQPRVKGNISVRSKKVSASAARKKAINAYIAWSRDQRLRLPTNLRKMRRGKRSWASGGRHSPRRRGPSGGARRRPPFRRPRTWIHSTAKHLRPCTPRRPPRPTLLRHRSLQRTRTG